MGSLGSSVTEEGLGFRVLVLRKGACGLRFWIDKGRGFQS